MGAIMKAFEVMRAKEYKEGRIKDWSAYRAEPKMDGVRVICTAQRGAVSFYSRNGRLLDMFSHLDASMLKIGHMLETMHGGYDKGVVFDGEMCGSTFNEIGGAIHRKGHTEKGATYALFHCMPLPLFEIGLDVEPQSQRRLHLEKVRARLSVSGVNLIDSLPVTGHGHLRSVYKRMLNEEYEGLMVKNMTAPWEAKRSAHWLKMKEAMTEDLPIVGWRPGKGKFADTLGALVVKRKDKEVRLSGMTDAVRHALFKDRAKLTTGKMVAEVEFQLVTVHGSLRHPRFVRLRADKEKA